VEDHALMIRTPRLLRFGSRPLRSGGRPGLAAIARVVGAVLVATLALVGSAASPAWAHAELSATAPVAGSVLATSPDAVVLTFTEGVSVEVDGVRVLDADAVRHDAGDATARDNTVTVPLRGDLADGGYVVAWRVVSADGHPIHGAFQFSVGTRAVIDPTLADRAFGASGDRRDEVLGAVFRGVAYLATLVVSGAVLVGTRLRRSDEPSPVSHRLGALAAVGVVAVALQVPVRASLATGRGWGSVTEAGVLGRSLGDGVGWALGLTIVGLVLVGIAAELPFRGAVRLIALVGAGLAPLGFALTGHTRTMSPLVVALVADLAHLAAAAVWFGGLVALVGILRRRRAADDVEGAGEAVARFSGLAGLALLLVAMTGSTLGVIEVGGLAPLTSTTYGRLLLAKVALVALVAAAGGWNRLRLLPVLAPARPTTDGAGTDGEAFDEAIDEADPGDAAGSEAAGSVGLLADDPRWRTLTRILRLEVAALVVVVGITAVLVNVTPARSIATDVNTSAPLGDGSLNLTVDPARAGSNEVHLFLLAPDGTPDDRYRQATVTFTLPALDVGPIEGEAIRVGAGHFQVDGADLSIAGSWVVTVSVQPDRFTKVEAEVPVRIR
jgi:copper transport protein